MVLGSFEVIESSRAFLRPGIATGIDSLGRPLLSVSWAASTAFRYVCARRSWRDPAGGRPAQVRGSARLVASVASRKVTTVAKRTQQLCGVGD